MADPESMVERLYARLGRARFRRLVRDLGTPKLTNRAIADKWAVLGTPQRVGQLRKLFFRRHVRFLARPAFREALEKKQVQPHEQNRRLSRESP